MGDKLNKYTKGSIGIFLGLVFLYVFGLFLMPPYALKEKSDLLTGELSAFVDSSKPELPFSQIFSGEWDYIFNSGGDYGTGKKLARRVFSNTIPDLESYDSYDLDNHKSDYRLSLISTRNKQIVTIISTLPISFEKQHAISAQENAGCYDFKGNGLVKYAAANESPVLLLKRDAAALDK